MSFMKIAPYYNSSMGETLYKLKSHSGDFVGKKVTKDLLNSNEFKQVIEDLTFSLRVKNIEVELNVDVKSYPMLSPSSGEKVSYAHYHSGNGGYTIKADCITLADDKTENQLNFKWLETYFLDKRPVNVVFDSEFVQNGVYDITDLSNLNLVRPNVYEFSIELITYTVNKPKLTNKVTVLQSRLKRCSKPCKTPIIPSAKCSSRCSSCAKSSIKSRLSMNGCCRSPVGRPSTGSNSSRTCPSSSPSSPSCALPPI